VLLDAIRAIGQKLRIGSMQRRDHSFDRREHVENTDAWAAVAGGTGSDYDLDGGGGGLRLPPGYVKSYDEGRPRK
jgi:hypothetical protein